jgi:hypothetical protein
MPWAGCEPTIPVDSKRFWQWCITHRTTGFLDFFHHLVF